MKHTVRKAFIDFEKEEKFLNEMSEKGLALIEYTWCKYVFEDAPEGEYIYRIELLENPVGHTESKRYIGFMEETGIEFVTSYNRWAYFRKKASDGEFDIYTDIDSKIRHYTKIMNLFIVIAAINFIPGILNYINGLIQEDLGIFPVNAYISVISFAVAALLLIFIIVPLYKKISRLEKDKGICE